MRNVRGDDARFACGGPQTIELGRYQNFFDTLRNQNYIRYSILDTRYLQCSLYKSGLHKLKLPPITKIISRSVEN